MKGFLDLVVCGPDMSGTGTQITDIAKYFISKGYRVRDIRGTETDALFHAEEFQGQLPTSLKNLTHLRELPHSSEIYQRFLFYAHQKLSGGGTNEDLQVASMIKNSVSTFVNPESADVWIMEEPTKRGAGQICRATEQNRSQYHDRMNGKAAAEAHSIYRTDEFLRFRRVLRQKGRIIIRSRSEESACYQIKDKDILPNGVPLDDYLNLEGHKIAFANPPGYIFVVCGPANWTEQDYLKLKEERSGGRFLDDHELNVAYQLLVNNRYATDWISRLYEKGCERHNLKVPQITRFGINGSKEEIKKQMAHELERILAH